MKTYLSYPLPSPVTTEARDAMQTVADNLRSGGFDVLTPLDVCDGTESSSSLITILTEIEKQCNQVWMADGWQSSPRCRCEQAFAQVSGMTILNHGGDLLTQAISVHYRNHGDTEEITYMTTAELYNAIMDIVPCELKDIAEWLQQNQFATCVIDGTIHWVLYDKRDPSIL